MKKIIKFLTAAVLIVACAAFLYACNDKNDVGYTDLDNVYKSSQDKSYFEAAQYVKLPTGVQVMTLSMTGTAATNQNYTYNTYLYRTNHTGYVDFADGFVLTNTASENGNTKQGRYYGFYKAGASDVTVEVKYDKIYFKYNLIVTQDSENLTTVFDTDGNIKLQQVKDATSGFNPQTWASVSSNYTIDQYVKVLSPKYIAYTRDQVAHVFSVETGNEVLAVRGADVTKIRVYDNYLFVTATGTNSRENVSFVKLSEDTRITSIPKSGDGWFEKFSTSSTDKLLVSYLGSGRFYILRQTAGSDTNYTYQDTNEAKFVAEMWFYDAATGTRTRHNGDVIPLSVVTLADAADSAVDLRGFLKGNYGYVGSAYILNEDKTAYFDQLIVDRDLNVVASLTNTLGYTGTESSDSIRDLALVFTNGYGVAGHMVSPGDIRVYDRYGNVKLTLTGKEFFSAKITRNFIIAGASVTDAATNTVVKRYGLYDMTGKEILPCEYDEVSEFSGNYALALKVTPAHKDEQNNDIAATYDYSLVDYLGNKIAANADTWGNVAGNDDSIGANIAWSSGGSGKPIYFGGVYVYKTVIDGENYYGVRNFNPDAQSSGLVFSTGIAEEAEHKVFKSVTLIRSNIALVGDLSYQYPEKVFAATQNEINGAWTLWTLTPGAAPGVIVAPVYPGVVPENDGFLKDFEFSQSELIIIIVVAAAVFLLLLLLLILVLLQRKKNADERERVAANKAAKAAAIGADVVAEEAVAEAVKAIDGGKGVLSKEDKKKAQTAAAAAKRVEAEKIKAEKIAADKERYEKAREKKYADEKEKAEAAELKHAEESRRRAIAEDDARAETERKEALKAEREKKYSGKPKEAAGAEVIAVVAEESQSEEQVFLEDVDEATEDAAPESAVEATEEAAPENAIEANADAALENAVETNEEAEKGPAPEYAPVPVWESAKEEPFTENAPSNGELSDGGENNIAVSENEPSEVEASIKAEEDNR
ncbi:MAG: WG repeat-containing protein [Clostridiaceae bacterium]|jgi:hypothetical protein|nr:WG repeat-containing protein [Clostridiaceae bacterium]